MSSHSAHLRAAVVGALLCATALLAAVGTQAVVFVPTPAWKFDNSAGRGHTTGPAGPIVAGNADAFGYVLASTVDYNTGNTTICAFNVMQNGTCTDIALVLPGTTVKTMAPVRASYHDAYIFNARDGDTGSWTTYRWSYKGIEWSEVRGKISVHSPQITNYFENTLILVDATADGTTETIRSIVVFDHQKTVAWSKDMPIPAASQVANTAYAQDFVWLYDDEPCFAYISLGRVFSWLANGTLRKQLDAPCGFTSTAFRMKSLTLNGDYKLLVYGNVAKANNGSDAFVVCMLDLDLDLNQTWYTVLDTSVTLASGDDSIRIIRTQFVRDTIPVTITSLFFSGSNDTRMPPALNTLYCIDVDQGKLVWQLQRSAVDAYNMPVFLEGQTDEHVGVSINGSMVGLNPVTTNQVWTCANIRAGCAGTPSVLRYPASGAIARIVCVSAANPARVIALDVTNATNPCYEAWAAMISKPSDVTLQNTPASVVTWRGDLEPFVAILSNDGTVWSMSYRSSSEPLPPPPPPPPPAPTLSPDDYPQPKYSVVSQPPYDFVDVELAASATVAPFSTVGPVVAATCRATIPEAHASFAGKRGGARARRGGGSGRRASARAGAGASSLNAKAALGVTHTFLYYESIVLQGDTAGDAGYFMLPSTMLLDRQVVVNSNSNGQFVVAATMANGDDDLILLRTFAGKNGGGYETFGRNNNRRLITANGQGTLYYSVGSVNSVERVNGIYQLGGDARSTVKFAYDMTAPSAINNASVNVGDLVYAPTSTTAGVVGFSYMDSYRIIDSATGAEKLAKSNPCGFAPSARTFSGGFYPMDSFHVVTAQESFIVAIVDTFKSRGTSTYGMCTFDLFNGPPVPEFES